MRYAPLAIIAALACAVALPSQASADVEIVTEKFKLDPVGGFDVVQKVRGGAPRPSTSAGHIVEIEADIVDGEGKPIPIDRLMLHHIVFLNIGRVDQSCNTITGFDGLQAAPGVERFFAAGEERAKVKLPEGYGYDLSDQTPGDGFPDSWAVLYMVMNHRSGPETDAYIEYTMKIEDGVGLDEPIQSVIPWWLDAANCGADPIYNVKGGGAEDSESVRSRDFYLNPDRLGATGGRIVAGGGHVHGGAYRLDISRPACPNDDGPFFSSVPKWGGPDHDFYKVRPILHEPGPVNMSAFRSATGFPVQAGQSLRLDSVYDDSQPHTRVMGISVVYIAPDNNVDEPCQALPLDNEVETLGPDPDDPSYREEPIPFTIPLVGEDPTSETGYTEMKNPPGDLKQVKDGTKIKVTNVNSLPKPNLKIHQGDSLKWKFRNSRSNLHNITLANGPQAIGSPNLSLDQAGSPRVFEKRFRKPGQYRLFCALHPTLMHERVVVKK
ncbi:MAG: hypothetical protein ABI726_00115 [bacterium]